MKFKTGVSEDAESDDGIKFEIRPRTSGLNRKLAVLRDFEEISGNLKVKTGTIEDVESDNVIKFEICPRTSG